MTTANLKRMVDGSLDRLSFLIIARLGPVAIRYLEATFITFSGKTIPDISHP
jgi:hypothetical protein